MGIYTRTGDEGTTLTGSHGRQSKASLQVETSGAFDRAIASLGFALCYRRDSLESTQRDDLDYLEAVLLWSQHRLFTCAICAYDQKATAQPIVEHDITEIERMIDGFSADTEALRGFILPGGSELAARVHLARTAVRDVERSLARCADAGLSPNPIALRFLNRLSDLMFSAARWVAQAEGHPEILWSQTPDTPSRTKKG